MSKFLFIFSNGVSCTIPANTKAEATIIVSNRFKMLFERQSVTITMLSYELDSAGEIITT